MEVSREGTQREMAFCLDVARIAPIERMDMVRRGVAPEWLSLLAGMLGIAEEHLTLYLGLDRRSVVARLADGARLEPQDSEPVVDLAKFIGDAMLLSRQADPALLGTWLRTPSAELERRAPIQYLDVAEGRGLVTRLWIEQHGGETHRQTSEESA